MTRSAKPGPTEALAALAARMKARSLPRHVIERAKDLVLDHIGVTLYGARLPWSAKVRNLVLDEGGRPESTIYGSRRVPARGAALANGTAAHAIEFDDTHDEALQHPGCVVIPAALAIGEALDRSGNEFLAAMVAGYDVQCRIGSALARHLMPRGFHPTSSCGVFGAAAAAGNLLRLNAATIVSALGSAASMSSGVMQFTEDPAGTMIKRLHAGLPAERGLLAAKLAAAGFAGPRQAIEGRYGFANVFTGEQNLARITDGLGEQFEIERISIKLYPCCKLFHSLIEAIAQCRDQRAFGPDDVAAIEAFGPQAMTDAHMEFRPQSTMAAQYSLPYTVAAAIVLDPSMTASFEPPMIARKEVLHIADLVKPRTDEALQALFPRRLAAGVRIRLHDGHELTSTVVDSRSSPERPITREDVQRKFLSMTAPILAPRWQQRIVDAVATLDRAKSLRDLTALLRRMDLSANDTGVRPTAQRNAQRAVA